MSGISVIVNVVKEDVKYLPRVLSSLKDFAEEIVLVDMSGDSGVLQIAKKYSTKVYAHEFIKYVEPARNFGIEKSIGEWILILDPDEELSKSLKSELKEVIEKEKTEYVRIPRKNIVFGKWLKYSRWWPDYNIRFFKKGYVSWGDEIHSVPITTGRGIDLPGQEEFAIIHHHYLSIEQYLERMNRYSGRQAEEKHKKGHEFREVDLIRKPVSEFLGRYFAGEGYKDGIYGLALSGLQAFSEFVVYLKLWQLKKFEEKDTSVKEIIETMRDVENDIHYWQADTLVKNGGGVLQRLRRKLKL